MPLRRLKLLLVLTATIVFIFIFFNYKNTMFVTDQRNKPRIKLNTKSVLWLHGGIYKDIFVRKDNSTSREPKRFNNKNTSIIRYPETIGKDMYVIENENVCKGPVEISILVFVHSSTGNFQERESIRQTWGGIRGFHSLAIRVIFILGKPESKSIQTAIEQEYDLYRDIVQGNFLDTYYNLTDKAVLGLRWVTEHCQNVKFAIKLDDDVYVNPLRLYKELIQNYFNTSWTIICKVRPKDTSEIFRSGKWRVAKSVFPNMTNWPMPHCPGHIVIYSGDLVPKLYAAARTTPFLWLDDVYVTGLLATAVGNVYYQALQKTVTEHVVLVKSIEEMYQLWHN